MCQAACFRSSLEHSRLKGGDSSAFGHQTLLISYHRINFIQNVTIEYIDGNWMRGVPLRCPYLYIIKKNRFVSCFLLLINLLYEEEQYEKKIFKFMSGSYNVLKLVRM